MEQAVPGAGVTGYTGTRYEPVGIVHHAEWFLTAADGGITHSYWSKELNARVLEHYTRQEWEEMLSG